MILKINYYDKAGHLTPITLDIKEGEVMIKRTCAEANSRQIGIKEESY